MPERSSSLFAEAILVTWRRNRAYGQRLLEDLDDAAMVAQPVPGVTMNHAAWCFSHLNVYAPIAASMLRGAPFEDPLDHPFGQKSAPINDPSAYKPAKALLAEYLHLHDDAEGALVAATDAVLARQNPLERWRGLHPTIGAQIVTLMAKHESMHLGQVSAWRRALGLPRVAI